MKLLVFSPYYPPHMGGLESHSAEFNQELVKLGYEVLVFTPNIPPTKGLETLNGIRIIRYPAFEIISNYPLPKFWTPLFWQQLQTLKSFQPDILITRTRFFFLSFIGLLFAKIHHIRHVHIEHGSDFVKLTNPLSSLLAKLYDHTFGKIVFHFSDINISISKAVHAFVMKFDTRFSPIIYRGLDFNQLDSIKPQDLALPEDKLIIMTAARLYKWKGIENTLKALREIPEETREKILFVLVGDGEDFERLKKLSVDLPVLLVGKKSREETLTFMKRADIYIHSSLPGGGLSTSLLEAMYSSCAIISTPHEGADEVLDNEKNGILQKDNQFATAIMELVHNPDKRSVFAANAKRTVLEKFSWTRSINQYIQLFENL